MHDFIAKANSTGSVTGNNNKSAPQCVIINANAKRFEKCGSRHNGLLKLNMTQIGDKSLTTNLVGDKSPTTNLDKFVVGDLSPT
jgi:hypothetical protein